MSKKLKTCHAELVSASQRTEIQTPKEPEINSGWQKKRSCLKRFKLCLAELVSASLRTEIQTPKEPEINSGWQKKEAV